MAKKLQSIKELFQRMPVDGKVRHELRSFNLGMMGAETLPSVLELAKRLGFDVNLVSMPKSQRGRLVTDTFSECGYRIEVNASDDVQTRRWTVLHEIMHALLHKRSDPFAFDQYRANQKSHFYLLDELQEEREANNAVEALIFGDGALQAGKTLLGDDPPSLAKHFGVSIPTLRRALKRL